MQNKRLAVFIEGAMMIAVAQILSLLPTSIGSSFTISIGAIPIILFALRHGWKKGTLIGLVYGVFKIIIGDAIWLHFAQGIIEYTFPYASLGFAGLFAKPLQAALSASNEKAGLKWISIASVTGVLLRFFWHFVAGVLYWGEYALEGWSPFVFSLVFNGASGLATALVVTLVLALLYSRSKRLFTTL